MSTLNPVASAQPSQDPKESATHESFKETLESILIAFILAFLFRTYIVEAFVIPSGSMAPTLLGDHLDLTCTQCGYRFAADVPDDQRNMQNMRANWGIAADEHVTCPMCHFPILVPKGTWSSAGDRILVQKYLYSLSPPRPFDVVVFKNPVRPDQNYIKRLIGLPNQSILIIDGNIYIGTGPVGQETWNISRKTDRPEVQRAVWRPIYHSDYIPLDGGADSPLRNGATWDVPWVAGTNSAGTWDLDNSRTYHFAPAEGAHANAPGSNSSGTIRFDFDRATHMGSGWYPYNFFRYHPGMMDRAMDPYPNDVTEEVRISSTFVPEKTGLGVGMQTTARFGYESNEPRRLIAKIDPDGKATLRLQPIGAKDDSPTDGYETIESGNVGAFAPGVGKRVELWYVDSQASLWVDGTRVLVHNFDPPSIEAAKRRLPFDANPQIAINVNGSPVTLAHVDVDRDIYYTDAHIGSTPGWGVIMKTRSENADGKMEWITRGEPIRLGPDQFFCLGDNSPMSQDGRLWVTADPWVEAELLSGKPQKYGIVPRELLMGRAFFVYFPAPFSWPKGSFPIIPNVADMRLIK